MIAVLVIFGFLWCAISAETAAEIAVDRGRSKWSWALIGFLFPLGGPLMVWLRPTKLSGPRPSVPS